MLLWFLKWAHLNMSMQYFAILGNPIIILRVFSPPGLQPVISKCHALTWLVFVILTTPVKGMVHPKLKFCHHSLTFMSFQTCTLFLLWNVKEDILRKSYRFEMTWGGSNDDRIVFLGELFLKWHNQQTISHV